MMIIVQIILWIIAVASVGLLALTFWGLYLKNKGQIPFDAAALAADGGKYATSHEDRKIEYFTYGSTDPSASVVVNMHGSGPEALSEKRFYAPICEALGVRGISISLPGYGYTDMKPGRQVRDWPRDDLEPVLVQEGVDQFMITGHSQGNPHALAAGFYFKDRCVGLGLNAPLLPAPICRELGIQGALAMDNLVTTETIRKPYMGAYFAVYYIGVKVLAARLPSMVFKPLGPRLMEDPRLVEIFRDTFARSTVRGIGSVWESTYDVCYEWGFDVRDVETRNVCVWHAKDDTACRPEHGAFLAKMFQEKGARVDFRDPDVGFGHVTFNTDPYMIPETSIVKAMLDGLE